MPSPGPDDRQLRVKRALLIATTTGYQLRSFGEAARAVGATLMLRPTGAISLTTRGPTAPSRCGSAVSRSRLPLPSPHALASGRTRLLPWATDRRFWLRISLPPGPRGKSSGSGGSQPQQAADARGFLRAGLPTPDFAVVSLHDDPILLASQAVYWRFSNRWRFREAVASCASTTARSSPTRSDGCGRS